MNTESDEVRSDQPAPSVAGPCYSDDGWRERQLALNAGRGTWGGNDGSVRGVLEAWDLPLEGFLRSLCDWGYEITIRAALASSDPGSPSDGGPYTEAGRKLHNDLASMMSGRPSYSNEWVRAIRQMIPLIEEQAHQLGMIRALSGSPSESEE